MQTESSVPEVRTDPDSCPVRPVAVGDGELRPYHQWKLHQLPDDFFVSTPLTDEQPLGCNFTRAVTSSEELTDAEAPRTPGNLSGAGDEGFGNEVSFTHLPYASGPMCQSDTQRLTPAGSESGDAFHSAAPEMPRGYSVRQLLRQGNRNFALAEKLLNDRLCQSKVYFQRSSGPETWQELELPIHEPGPGQRFSHLASLGNRLYLVMDDEVAGFRMWCAEVNDSAQADWMEVITYGAFAFTNNAHVTAIFTEESRMLIACAATRTLAEFEGRPVAAELIVLEDDGWGLIIGTTRVCPEGLVVPLGARGRGFDDPDASIISSICKSGDEYLVSLHSTPSEELETVNSLWSSSDLLDWEEVELPPELTDEDLTLLGACRQGDGLLFVVQLFQGEPDMFQELSQFSSNLTQAALPDGIEIWVQDHA